MHADMTRTGRDGVTRALSASTIGPDRARVNPAARSSERNNQGFTFSDGGEFHRLVSR